MLPGFVLLTVVGLVTVVPVLGDWWRQHGLHRRAERLEGRVVDNDFHSYHSLRNTRPRDAAGPLGAGGGGAAGAAHLLAVR